MDELAGEPHRANSILPRGRLAVREATGDFWRVIEG